ncbi:hypothetical protein AcV7_008167 [Taiwanofungus camphoratus]|nr:hypothetical protein AcV7_008167 [Antrodia cinnamomea]
MIDIEWESPDKYGRRRRPKASTVHGWVTKLRGTLTGNERVRSRGIREMREASIVREYYRKRDAKRRAQERKGCSGILSLFSSPKKRRSRGQSHRRDVVIHRDYGRKGTGPWMHFSHRTKPLHHGHGTRFKGHLTNKQELVLRGQKLDGDATRERHKERRRRQRQSKREAAAMKADGAVHRWDWRH